MNSTSSTFFSGAMGAVAAGAATSGLLYHMARAYDDGAVQYAPSESFSSMVRNQFIEGQPNKGYFARMEGVRSVSFSGSRFIDLGKLVSRRSPFGICFKRDLIDPAGTEIRPVHYLERGAIDLIRQRGIYPEGLSAADRHWIDLQEEGVYSFSWEEEWRRLGNLRFNQNSVVFLIVPTLDIGARLYSRGYNSIPTEAIYNPVPHLARIEAIVADARRKARDPDAVDEVEIENGYLAWLAYSYSDFYEDFYPKIRAEMRRDEEREIYTDSGELRDPDGEWNLHEAAAFDLDNMLDEMYEDSE